MESYRHILDKKANFLKLIKTGESGNTFVATSCYKDSLCKWLVLGGISSLKPKSASMTVRLSAAALYWAEKSKQNKVNYFDLTN